MAVSSQTKGSSIELIVYLEAKQEAISEAAGKLADALAFLDQCRSDPTSSETGAKRDAIEGVEHYARRIVATVERPLEWR